ncbi:hypothetical protein jhhlp_006667 [Lomentospora prolificans]|uniref:Uncharacterized protein n=1 Tax=Lomentospora prolificans TaxID=41688 RepID=A0A2N3N6J4_9PEZI|nr:hypothetical protein jhhlp_006667 [Lomentospora prolificans]
MKAVSVFAVLAAVASAAEMRACTGTGMNGACEVGNNVLMALLYSGKYTTGGTWHSYNWRSSINRCIRVCSGCNSLGWRCQDYSNSNIGFNKFIIFDWANGSGPDSATCC